MSAQEQLRAAKQAADAGSNGAGPSDTLALRWQWADELEAPPEPVWIWNGLRRARCDHAPRRQTKVRQKSTLACALAEALSRRRQQLPRPPAPTGGVVYLSEEGAGTLKPKLHGQVRTLTRDGAWPRPDWATLIEAAITEANRIGATVLIIDSLGFWGSLDEGQENDSAVMQRTLGALGAATSAGLAVVLVHHQRKGGGEDGDAVRGSGAIFAARRHADRGRTAQKRQRTHPPAARRDRTMGGRAAGARRRPRPARALLAGGRARRGTGPPRASSRSGSGSSTRSRSRTPGTTESELAELLEIDTRKVSGPLRKLVDDGAVTRAGEGRKGDPYRYRKMLPQNAPPSRGASRSKCCPTP